MELGTEYRGGGGVLKEIRGLPISETSEKCKRGVDKDVKYIVPKMDSTNSLSDEEGKEEVINVRSSSGTICKQNRIKNPPSIKLGDFLWSI